MNHAIIYIGILLLILPWGCGAEDIPTDLQIITEDYAPLNFVENGTLKGISVDIMEMVLQQLGSNKTRADFQVLPWTQGYQKTLTTPNTILLTADRLPEREDLFIWVGPVITNQEVLYLLADSANSVNLDIKSLQIVAITDDCGKSYAIAAGADEKKISEVPSAKDAIAMLENGSADAWVYNEIAGYQAITRNSQNPDNFIIGKDLGTSEYYFAFNKNTSPEWIEELNATYQSLKRDRSLTGITPYEEIIARYLPVQCSEHSTPLQQVTDLVNSTAKDIAADTPGTLASINAGQAPYRDEIDKELYAFVFDTNVTIMANGATHSNVGKNLAGTTDVTGKAFRDEIVQGAIRNNTGWVMYTYSNPDSLGLYQKMSYYRLVNGSDGVSYVVGAGRYQTCEERNNQD